MAGSCTPSKAGANCVLLHSKQMTGRKREKEREREREGEKEGETFEVNEGMGYLLRKSGGQ